jgi:hypothetical protein
MWRMTWHALSVRPYVAVRDHHDPADGGAVLAVRHAADQVRRPRAGPRQKSLEISFKTFANPRFLSQMPSAFMFCAFSAEP